MQNWEYRSVEFVGSNLTKLEVQSIDYEWIPFRQRTLFIRILERTRKKKAGSWPELEQESISSNAPKKNSRIITLAEPALDFMRSVAC